MQKQPPASPLSSPARGPEAGSTKGCGPGGGWGPSPACYPHDRPLAAFIVQYFNRGDNILRVVEGLARVKPPGGTEILVRSELGKEDVGS